MKCFNMSSLSLITVVVALLQCVTCDFWSFKSFDQLVNVSIEQEVNSRSLISCLGYCESSSLILIEMVTFQGGVCYCLNPQPNSSTKGQTTLSSVYALSSDSICRYKGYEMLPEFGICIKYYSISYQWQRAQEQCNDDSGYLINLNTEEKMTTISNMTLAYNVDLIHVGAFYDDSTMTFNWTRGGLVDERFWFIGEPSIDIIPLEFCVAIYKPFNEPKLGNLKCSLHKSFLCEVLL